MAILTMRERKLKWGFHFCQRYWRRMVLGEWYGEEGFDGGVCRVILIRWFVYAVCTRKSLLNNMRILVTWYLWVVGGDRENPPEREKKFQQLISIDIICSFFLPSISYRPFIGRMKMAEKGLYFENLSYNKTVKISLGRKTIYFAPFHIWHTERKVKCCW